MSGSIFIVKMKMDQRQEITRVMKMRKKKLRNYRLKNLRTLVKDYQITNLEKCLAHLMMIMVGSIKTIEHTQVNLILILMKKNLKISHQCMKNMVNKLNGLHLEKKDKDTLTPTKKNSDHHLK